VLGLEEPRPWRAFELLGTQICLSSFNARHVAWTKRWRSLRSRQATRYRLNMLNCHPLSGEKARVESQIYSHSTDSLRRTESISSYVSWFLRSNAMKYADSTWEEQGAGSGTNPHRPNHPAQQTRPPTLMFLFLIHQSSWIYPCGRQSASCFYRRIPQSAKPTKDAEPMKSCFPTTALMG
jgi:hypothetical protein